MRVQLAARFLRKTCVMRCFVRSFRGDACLFASFVQLLSAPAWCASAEQADEQRSAAAEFDAGVGHFEQGRYEDAARSFLRAHTLVPSGDALTNALVSAERASSPALSAEAASRVLDSGSADASSRATAQRLLDEALPSVARLHLSCAPAPCELELRGEAVASGRHYLHPGAYRVSASNPQTGQREERDERFEAGAEYELAFDLGGPQPQVQPQPQVAVTPSPAPVEAPHPRTSLLTEAPRDVTGESVLVGKDTISYVAVATTAALVGVTAWSGIDTLRYRSALGGEASQAEIDEVGSKIRRTDLLLGVSFASALATTAWFLWGTDITTASGGTRLDVAVHPTGATLSARGAF